MIFYLYFIIREKFNYKQKNILEILILFSVMKPDIYKFLTYLKEIKTYGLKCTNWTNIKTINS